MGLLGDIRKFLKRIAKNPVKTGIVAYIVYKVVKDSGILSTKEAIELKLDSLKESIIIKGRANGKELIFDTVTKKWAVIDGSKILFSGDESNARKFFKKYSNRVSESKEASFNIKPFLQVKNKLKTLDEVTKWVKSKGFNKHGYCQSIAALYNYVKKGKGISTAGHVAYMNGDNVYDPIKFSKVPVSLEEWKKKFPNAVSKGLIPMKKESKSVGVSLFYAGDVPPSQVIKKEGRVFGFSSLAFAKGWKKKYNRKHIYQFMSDSYKLDKKTYVRDTDTGKKYSDNEYVCSSVKTERLIEKMKELFKNIKSKRLDRLYEKVVVSKNKLIFDDSDIYDEIENSFKFIKDRVDVNSKEFKHLRTELNKILGLLKKINNTKIPLRERICKEFDKPESSYQKEWDSSNQLTKRSWLKDAGVGSVHLLDKHKWKDLPTPVKTKMRKYLDSTGWDERICKEIAPKNISKDIGKIMSNEVENIMRGFKGKKVGASKIADVKVKPTNFGIGHAPSINVFLKLNPHKAKNEADVEKIEKNIERMLPKSIPFKDVGVKLKKPKVFYGTRWVAKGISSPFKRNGLYIAIYNVVK